MSLASTVASGCGDDGGGDVTAGDPSTGQNTTAPSTGSADDGPDPTTQGEDTAGTSTLSGDSTTMAPADSSGSGSEGSGSGSGSDDASGSSTATETGDSSSSSSEDGGVVPGCEICEDDEVCVVNQGLANEFDCQPTPKACDADVDCDCGASLCVEPFVGCFDPPESSTLFCACIAC